MNIMPYYSEDVEATLAAISRALVLTSLELAAVLDSFFFFFICLVKKASC
jgi:hypothetical protein